MEQTLSDHENGNVFLADVMPRLLTSNLREILSEIKSDKYDWKGTNHSDTTTKYQARKCIQTALVLLITSRILLMEDNIEEILNGEKDAEISLEEARSLFYDHIRHLNNQYKGDSGTSNIRFDIIPNLFKAVANYLPSENGA
ncbi:MAG: hypothetical protein PHX80_05210 [Candidatus Nanoarchaeia archaeon]|nr:hypothetical protein [Candidatus Nanoarchaeia archaeon]